MLANILCWLVHCAVAWHGPWKPGWVKGVGQSTSIYPNSGILIKQPLAGKASIRNDSSKLFFKEVAYMYWTNNLTASLSKLLNP
jgi:hypothetical protein